MSSDLEGVRILSIAGQYFYHAHTRRLILAFGKLFTDMTVARYDENGNVIGIVRKVPIEYLSNDKYVTRRNAQEVDGEDLGTRGHITYPRMAYNIVGYRYDASRKLSQTQRIIKPVCDSDQLVVVPVQTPYTFDFELQIEALNMTDALQLFEQIAYAFTPSVTLTIRDVPFTNDHADIPITLTNVQMLDNGAEHLEEGRRLILFNLTFSVEYWLYGPSGAANELSVQQAIEGTTDVTLPAIKPRVEKLVIDIYGNESEFYTGNDSGVRFNITDEDEDGIPEVDVDIPPTTP